jgi:hypothetical protein
LTAAQSRRNSTRRNSRILMPPGSGSFRPSITI